jgi:hypothetical protein
MAKKEVAAKTEVAVQAQNPVALPAQASFSPRLKALMNEVRDNLASLEGFRLPRIKMTSDGAEIIEGEKPADAIEGILLHTKKTNVYYEKPFNPSTIEPPTCFSTDGERPDSSIATPQNPTCKGCKQAEFGTNQMKSGKACRNLKPLYLLLSDEAIMPRQLTITPTALKAANKYLLDLTERGLSYRKVRTRIEFYKENARDTYVRAKFRMLEKLTPEMQADAESLRNFWLPVMNEQSIDQAEFSSEETSAPQAPLETKGEF